MQLLGTQAPSRSKLLIVSWQNTVQPVLAPFLVSRILILCASLILQWLLDSGQIHKFRFIGDAPLAPLSATFDANAYSAIATNGYSSSPDVSQPQDYHFFPLYPILMRLVGNLLGLGGLQGGYNLAGLVLSHIFLLASLSLIYRLTITIWNDQALAQRTIWLLCALPWAHVFSMAYTESLFLMLTAGAMLLAFNDRVLPPTLRVGAASVLATLATLTRPQGFIVALTVAWLVALVPRGLALHKRLLFIHMSILPPLLAGVGFAIYIAAHTGSGNLLAIQQTTLAWGDSWVHDLQRVFSLPAANPMWFLDMQATVTLLLWTALSITFLGQFLNFFRGKHSLFKDSIMSPMACFALMIYSAGSFLVTLLGNPMNIGWGRYMLIIFPLVWLLAARLPQGATFHRIIVVALATQVVFMFGVVTLQFTP